MQTANSQITIMTEIFEKFKNNILQVIIENFEEEHNSYRFAAVVRLNDGSSLHIRDYKFENGERKYSYHWMDEKEKLICRWDNADHWKDIPTFPHHKHIGSIEKVESSMTVNLEDVLTEIITIIKSKMK